jgi:hypothetical protein
MRPVTRATCKALVLGAALALLSPLTRAEDPPFRHYRGYHGPDGTQNYPGCNPPIESGGAEKKNGSSPEIVPSQGPCRRPPGAPPQTPGFSALRPPA